MTGYLPHHIIGYWGFGQPETLEQQLSQMLNRLKISSKVQRTRSSGLSSPLNNCWGIAYIGQSTIHPDPVQSGPLATLCAGGIFNRQADGTLLPDAWVNLKSGSDSVALELGRDSFGRVPLYWRQQDQVIWFASRLQFLLPESPVIHPAALYGYSCFSYVPTPLTPIQGVYAVPAGMEQIWQWQNGEWCSRQSHIHQWQELDPPIQDEETAVKTLQTLLKTAVAHQVADLDNTPVGVALSGGLDSSIVAALLVQMRLKVKAYTLDFGLPDRSELSYAEQVAQFLNIPLITVEATPRRIRRAIAATAQALDLPFGDGVTVPLFLLNQVAAQETAVIFNGEHGDQLFAGWTNKPLIAAGIYGTLAQAPEAAFDQQYLQTFHRLQGYESQIFQPELAAACAALDPTDWLQEALDPQFSTTLLHRLRRANLMLKGGQNIQPRATALAWAHGLNVRSLFCNSALADFAFRLSGNLCLRGSCEKYILKRAVESWLPSEIVWRSKRGMGVPLTFWCFNELWRDLGFWLNPTMLRDQSHWQPDIATQILAGRLGTIQGRRMGECLWLILMWQAWRSSILQESPRRSWNHPFWLPPQIWRELNRWQNF